MVITTPSTTAYSQNSIVDTTIVKNKPMSKKSASNDSKAKRNLTLMIVCISFLFTAGTLPWAVYYTLASLISIPNLYPLQVLSSCCLYLLVSLKIFIYYFFNRLFRQLLQSYFFFIFKFFRIKR